MEHVWKVVEELRLQYEALREDRTPIDVFAFFEIDLGLNPIPFDDLTAKYRVEAAITADFTGIYLDAEEYALMERGPVWKLNKLRFTVAHELAHFFLSSELRPVDGYLRRKKIHDRAGGERIRWATTGSVRPFEGVL